MFTKALLPDTIRALKLVANISIVKESYIIRSLNYFTDADREDDLEMIIPLGWQEVKGFFQKQTIALAKSKLKL